MTSSSAFRRDAGPTLPGQAFGRFAGLCAIFAGIVSGPAKAAETKFLPFATTIGSYDSNVFRVSSNAFLPVIGGQQVRDDYTVANTLGFDTSYAYSQQELHSKIQGSRYDYFNLPSLSHFEYALEGGLRYDILSRVTGDIDFAESRRQSRFEDRNDGQLNTRLNFDRDRSGSITTRFLISNDWALDGGYRLHELNTPVIGASSLKLTDNTSNAALNYVGISKLTVGATGSYVDGQYSGIAGATSFTQYSYGGSVRYAASEKSSFTLDASYSTRRDSNIAPTSGLTGDASYNWNITEKTLVIFSAYRRIASYAAGDNTVVETGLSNETHWRPTEKTQVELTYSYAHVAFKNQGLTSLFDLGRIDQTRSAGLGFTYLPLDWLETSLNGVYAVRHSSQLNSDYNAATISINITARLK